MAHERTSLRNAVIAQLTGATVAGTRVYGSRLGPLREHELPCLCVYVDSEIVTEDSVDTSPRELTRIATVAVEAFVSVGATGDVETTLDDLCLAVETAMDQDLAHNGTAGESILVSTELGLRADGHRPMAAARMEYDITYHTSLRLAVPVDKFDTAHVVFDLAGGQAPADRATDVLEGLYAP